MAFSLTRQVNRFVDRVNTSLEANIYKNDRYFSKSLVSPPLKAMVLETEIQVEKLGSGTWHTVEAASPAGKFEAGYLVYRLLGIEKPTVLFVYGSGEQPHDFSRFGSNSFRSLVTQGFKPEVNLAIGTKYCFGKVLSI